MLLPNLYWPLEVNMIRKNSVTNTFGMVRNGGQRPHQGWDLQAVPGTPCFAIADGVIKHARSDGDYGKTIVLEFEHRGRTLYAVYAHLNRFFLHKTDVVRGEMIGMTGNTGNAEMMQGDDQHLHFEIRTIDRLGKGLGGRLNPKDLYGFTPQNTTVCDSRPPAARKQTALGPGLKVRGVNVL